MNQSDMYQLECLRSHLLSALHTLEDLGKLPRFTQNLEFMLDELDQYIKLQEELENVE